MINTVLENVMETLDAFEERAGVRLSALSAVLTVYESPSDSISLQILGEVHAREGMKLPHPIRIVASAYDASGRLIKNSDTDVDAANFFGFETFTIYMDNLPTMTFSKIRVVPRVTG